MKILLAAAAAAVVVCLSVCTAARSEPAPDDTRYPVVSVEKHVAKYNSKYNRRPAADPIIRIARAGMVTVQTAAGIPITVAATVASKFQGAIADMVASGYTPRRIHCYATDGHVRNSFHYRGEACDFDQRGWNKTASTMYRVAAIAARHGLRDGCSFRDCGHLDAGTPFTRSARHHHRRVHEAKL